MAETYSNEVIINFIEGFTKYNKEVIVNLFTNGYCYWFAHILKTRFNGVIVMDKYGDHFMTKINDRIYDITGCVDCTSYIIFDEYKEIDPLHYNRLIRDCVNKVNNFSEEYYE